jgi:hypothetical protein
VGGTAALAVGPGGGHAVVVCGVVVIVKVCVAASPDLEKAGRVGEARKGVVRF